jgi:3-oxoacyl-[acyl-carrier protein] reductase
MRLEGKTAVITGAARGIGKEIAIRFAEEGAAVVLVDMQPSEETESQIRALGGPVLSLAVDITDYHAIESMMTRIHEWRGSVDILVNNAGIITREGILDLTKKQWLKIMDVNLNGTFYMCKAVLPDMVAQR